MRLIRGLMAVAVLLAAPAWAEVPIGVGEPATVRLSPQGALAFPVRPPLPRAPANHGAILSFDVDEPGRYHVALSAPGRVDVVREGKALAMAGEQAGAAKIAAYDLAPGHYVLQLSSMLAGEVEVMIGE